MEARPRSEQECDIQARDGSGVVNDVTLQRPTVDHLGEIAQSSGYYCSPVERYRA
jgi:hypothetical protein